MSQHTKDARKLITQARKRVEEQKLDYLPASTLNDVLTALHYLASAIEDMENVHAPNVCVHSQVN